MIMSISSLWSFSSTILWSWYLMLPGPNKLGWIRGVGISRSIDYLPAIDYEVQDTPDEALRWRDRGEEDAAKKRNLRVILEDCPCPKNTFAEMQWA